MAEIDMVVVGEGATVVTVAATAVVLVQIMVSSSRE